MTLNTNSIINVLSWASIRSKYKYKKQRELSLSLQHITALLIIVESSHNGIYQKELIKTLKWSKQNVMSGSCYLGKLIDSNLIERRRGLGRYWVCYPTNAGLKASRKLYNEIRGFDSVPNY